MSKLARHSGKMVAILAASTFLSVSGFAETVYDNSNSQFYRGQNEALLVEFGDQVTLAPTTVSRDLSSFSFNYLFTAPANSSGQPITSGNESVRVRLYANDGPGTIASPGTQLGSEFVIPITPEVEGPTAIGANIRLLYDPGTVQLPETFTWTVLFEGLDSQERAGLLLFDPPSVGSSYNDFWVRGADGSWTTQQLLGGAANFAARIEAVPELGTFQYGMLGGLVWIGCAIRRRLFSK
jgi:hypothetical protein